MALTREFTDTVKTRLESDGEFRLALLKEAMDNFLEGDVATGKALLRDYINATLGFEKLAALVATPSKSLHRMLGPNGNPRAANLFRMLAVLQKAERVGAKVEFQSAGLPRTSASLGVQEAPAAYGAVRWARGRAARHRKRSRP